MTELEALYELHSELNEKIKKVVLHKMYAFAAELRCLQRDIEEMIKAKGGTI